MTTRPLSVPVRATPVRAILVGLAAALGLAACSTDERELPACPEVRMERDTAALVAFRPGGGRDLTDVMFEARVTGYTGDCAYSSDGSEVNVTMKVEFAISRGPAFQGNQGSFEYFAAIPAFYPAAEGKAVFPLDYVFPGGNIGTILVRDEEISLTIPLRAGLRGSDTPIYIGFQMSPEQLEYNRSHRY